MKTLSSSSSILLTLLWVGSISSSVFGHAADERSHQVITIQATPSGGNILFEMYCGPKLSQTFTKALAEAPTAPPEKINSTTAKALVGQEPWVKFTLGDLREVLRQEPALPKPRPFSFHPKATPLSEILKWIDENPLHRHNLFSFPSSAQKEYLFSPHLELQQGHPKVESYQPESPENIKGNPKELLKLTYIYSWSWPKEYHRNEGITVSVETILKTFTSNSVFLFHKPKEGTVLMDQLNAVGSNIKPEQFLTFKPSKRFKVRKAIFIYEWPERRNLKK